MAEASKPLLYSDEVNYRDMDPFKIACLQAAITTASNISRFERHGLIVKEVTESRGESAYEVDVQVLRPQRFRIASVEEGLGTKNVIALQMRELQEKLLMAKEAKKILGKSFYRGIAIDNAEMILNDLATRGASPITFMLHVAAESSEWFNDQERRADLITGTLDACNDARCTWGGGESPTLRDIINPGHALLSGSAVGLEFAKNNKYLSADNLKEGQRIVLFESSGPHSNGITLLRKGLLAVIAQRMMGINPAVNPEKVIEAYGYELDNGQSYGEAILTPTIGYSRLMDELIERGCGIEYAIHISGHGWRKLMRAQKNLSYVIDKIPEPQSIFRLIQEASGMSNKQIYADYNMNAGFAAFAEPTDVPHILSIGKKFGYKGLDAGVIEPGPIRVVINPLGVEYTGETLQIR